MRPPANRLQWTTASEINVKEFVVEKSSDGRAYTSIGTVAAGGYRYTFADPAAGNAYYRLKIADKDGAFTWGPVVYIRTRGAGTVQIYPDPVQNTLQVRHSVDSKYTVVEVMNLEGKILKRQPSSRRQRQHAGRCTVFAEGWLFVALWERGKAVCERVDDCRQPKHTLMATQVFAPCGIDELTADLFVQFYQLSSFKTILPTPGKILRYAKALSADPQFLAVPAQHWKL